jgi:hypothetical protein
MISSKLEEIIIVDDDHRSAQRSKFLVEDLDLKPRLVTDGTHNSVEELLAHLSVTSDGKTGVLCDHRLMYHKGFANFYGSEFVAALYHRQIPAILLTQYADSDIDVSIRKYRRWMPVMIPRDELNMATLPEGFDFCARELAGKIPESRRPYRTLIEISNYTSDGGEDVAEALVPGWNSEHIVRFPLALMSAEIKANTINTIRAKQSAYVFAQVNVGAEYAGELFFDEFEWATVPRTSTLDRLLNELKSQHPSD